MSTIIDEFIAYVVSCGSTYAEDDRHTNGGKKTGVVRKMTTQVPDGIVAVVKGLMDDDNPEVKRRMAAVTRALQQPAKLVREGSWGGRLDGGHSL